MDHRILDGMKKEGRMWRILMIFGYALSILMPLAICIANDPGYSTRDAIVAAVIFFLWGSLGLYGWLYAIKYHVEISEDKIVLKTLFNNMELGMQEISGYSCKRYNKTVFYQFSLDVNGRKVLVNTRYKDEFLEILRANGIAEKG